MRAGGESLVEVSVPLAALPLQRQALPRPQTRERASRLLHEWPQTSQTKVSLRLMPQNRKAGASVLDRGLALAQSGSRLSWRLGRRDRAESDSSGVRAGRVGRRTNRGHRGSNLVWRRRVVCVCPLAIQPLRACKSDALAAYMAPLGGAPQRRPSGDSYRACRVIDVRAPALERGMRPTLPRAIRTCAP